MSGFSTKTPPVPALPAEVVQVIEVAETTDKPVHRKPRTLTVAPATKPVPVIVIAVPPAVLPDAGATVVIVGVDIAMYVNPPVSVATSPGPFVT
ncbi:unannotated protein [freshwater metagenome]|uniref:Unannotated protein n=1 Tax=freshwater metagenome TaxID=449393 RepID=A0A6J7BIP9_9ZZZZ